MKPLALGLALAVLLGAAPRRADAWNFAYARVGKAFAEVKKLALEKLKSIVTQVFGPIAEKVMKLVESVKGKVQDVANKATRFVSETMTQIREQTLGRLEKLGREIGDKLAGSFVRRLSELKEKGEAKVGEFLAKIEELRKRATEKLAAAIGKATAAVLPKPAIIVGVEVEGRRPEGERAERGKVIEVYGKLAAVRFGDGEVHWLAVSDLSPRFSGAPEPADKSSFAPGMRIVVPWGKPPKTLPAVVLETYGRLVRLRIDGRREAWLESAAVGAPPTK